MDIGWTDKILSIISLVATAVSVMSSSWVWYSDVRRRRHGQQRLADAFGALVKDLADSKEPSSEGGVRRGRLGNNPLGNRPGPR